MTRCRSGNVVAGEGSVVDIQFPDGVPRIRSRVDIGGDPWPSARWRPTSTSTPSAAWHSPTRGIARGTPASTDDQPITSPVGSSLLGRDIDVFGNPIDRDPPKEDAERRPIYQPSVPLEHRPTGDRILETGIKALDLCRPSSEVGRPGCSAVPGSARPS